ncbi:MutL C terminal dimerization domain-containing protein [Mycena albidolilacea]|uniref:MutL C terminal dimerization domain-containing protein n=1 Tax=Mycena albidolilacea TaxID=1033008 RepID=A0AAD6ZMQ9_9AGAR|nr:MutL C terminal dimerization domain-containing protein [Mycena albidolilacea]
MHVDDVDAQDASSPVALDSRADRVSAVPPSNIDNDEITIIQPDNAQSVPHPRGNSSVIELTDDDLFESSELSSFALDTGLSATHSLDEAVSRPEVIRTSGGDGDLSLRVDLSKISSSWRRLHGNLTTASARREPESEPSSSKVLLDAGITDAPSDDVATEALARTISKADFGAMEILGQFNLGFIITRRRKEKDGDGAAVAMDDLFIVDQHAADEKYNFETLQQTTRIKSQKLFRAQALELTAGDELLAMENIEVLRQNGFEVETAAEGDSGPRLSLTAQPISKDTVFDMKDLEELIHRMRDQPAGQMVRCSKARAMFAMRACRKSVMIGMPLNKGQMTGVVRHMGTMDQPWNCPHGRPTMRHLADIVGEHDRRGVNWAGFASG